MTTENEQIAAQVEQARANEPVNLYDARAGKYVCLDSTKLTPVPQQAAANPSPFRGK